MTFYFAWVGGDPIAAFNLATVGDIWGGSTTIIGQVWSGRLETTADFLPSGVWLEKVKNVTNMTDVAGLVVGNIYNATIGTLETTFVYEGDYSGTLGDGVEPKEGGSMLLELITGTNQIVLDDIAPLTSGVVYGIAGSGIPENTTFTFSGSATIVLSANATATGRDVSLTISSDVGQNIITNIGSTAGLVVGEIYQIFGRGLDPTVLGTFQSNGTMVLSAPATESTRGAFIRIHHGIIYPDGGAFDEETHAVEDEVITLIRVQHSEGNFPMLTIDLKNPRLAYLAPGRNVWCWLSWRELDGVSPGPVVPLFHGRLVAVPENIQNEKVTLMFRAKPDDYENLQALLSATLRVAPYWDPIWYDNGVDDATTILEARTAQWHIDRVTLAVSISDITSGEDGTITITEAEHVYADMNFKIDNPPLSSVYMTGTVNWSQQAVGSVDITKSIVRAFKEAGSRFGGNNISAYQGSGLLSSWPKPLSNIGGGWSVDAVSTIEEVTTRHETIDILTKYTKEFSAGQDFDDRDVDEWGNPTGSAARDATGSYTETHAIFRMNVYDILFVADFEASRDWTETVSFFMEADVQQVATDSRASTEAFSLSSSLVSKPIDPGGLTPLRYLYDNTYFKTERGQDSFKFLLAYAKAKLVSRARAVEITFTTTWQKAIDISCRKNVHIIDGRLPGGQAIGKVTEYILEASASGGMKATVTIGCTIGEGGAITAVPGTSTYVDSGYADEGYFTVVGGTVDIGDSTITFENFDDFEIIDDGVDFRNMTANTVVKRCVVSGGINQQKMAIAASKALPAGSSFRSLRSEVKKQPPDAAAALSNCYPSVLLELVSVTGGGFLSDFVVDVSKLVIPKTIDLEASGSP